MRTQFTHRLFATLGRISESPALRAGPIVRNSLRCTILTLVLGVQQNLTSLLRSQLDADDRCGDRIAIQHGSLTPGDPSSLEVVQLPYERYTGVKERAHLVQIATLSVTISQGLTINCTEPSPRAGKTPSSSSIRLVAHA